MSEDHDKRPPTFWQKAKPPLEFLGLIATVSGVTVLSFVGGVWLYIKNWIGYGLLWWLLGSIAVIAAIIRLWTRRRTGHPWHKHLPETIAADDILKGIGVEPFKSAPEANPPASEPQTKEDPPAEMPADTPKLESPPVVPRLVTEPSPNPPYTPTADDPARPRSPTKQATGDQPPSEAQVQPPKRPSTARMAIGMVRMEGEGVWGKRYRQELPFGFRFDWQGDWIVNLKTLCPDCGTVMALGPDQEITGNPNNTLFSCPECGLHCALEVTQDEFRRTVARTFRDGIVNA